MESFKSNCFGELIDNNTLSEEPDDGGMTIADAVREVLCPGLPECSGNGACVNGQFGLKIYIYIFRVSKKLYKLIVKVIIS